jgi:hypothetical protein
MSGILLASVGNSYGSLPANVVAPVITGTATIGSTLTTSDGTWTGAPAPTFSYQWQRVTTDISGATSSTYVVQLADAGNTIRCVVTATNSLGAVSANTANTASVPLPAIGSALEGGFYAGQIGVSSVPTHYIVVAPLSSGQTVAQWKTSNTATPGSTSDINGPANTAAQVAAGSHPCATFCNNVVIGGFSDWYMPAKNELDVCYFNLKPGTVANSTNGGTNANAVPARASNYTGPPPPAQTSAAAFQTGGAEAFAVTGPFLPGYYWSSTETSASTSAYGTFFYNGNQGTNGKGYSAKVRAIRRVAV